jgi:RsiW-degrading membrane proteinase PrsW (M82 family)
MQDPPAPAPAQAPPEVRFEADAPTTPLFSVPLKRSLRLTIVGVVGIAGASILTVVLAVYLLSGLGPNAFALGGILALVPLGIVLIGVNWIDRWEPEPRGILIFAFLWGAGAAVVITVIVGVGVDRIASALNLSVASADFFGAVVQAPLVEELAKGVGIVLIFLFAHKHFDGPVDGIVYAAWVAGGFAFTENIVYFGGELLDSFSPIAVAEVFLIRGLMSPFAHIMFTSFFGIALGLAARRSGVVSLAGFFALGLVPAVMLHALWNGALFLVNDFFAYYVVVQFPLFVGGVLIVLYLRRQEARLTHLRLSEYAQAGWFNPEEINALATGAGRRRTLAWAKERGVNTLMRNYVRDATRLAFTRQRLITGRGRVGAEADEAALLSSIVATRHTLQASL